MPRRFRDRIGWSDMKKWLSPTGLEAAHYCYDFAVMPESKAAPLLIGGSGTGKTHILYACALRMFENVKKGILEAAERATKAADAAIEAGKDHDPSATEWPNMPPPLMTCGSEIAHEVRQSVRADNLDEVVAYHRQEQAAEHGYKAVLFVDDVEVMKMSDWLHEELYRIFDYRYEHDMPTPMATNLSPEELKRHLGDRIARRILDMSEPFILEA